MKFAGRLFLFIVSALIAYSVLFVTLYSISSGGIPLVFRAVRGNVWPGGGTYVKFKEFDKGGPYDIVILGSSHAYRGYDPRNFESLGYKTFNLGTSDQNIICSYHIAKGYLHRSNCKMVILDIYDRVFTRENFESFSDVIQNVSSDPTAIKLAVSSHDIRAINTLALRYCNKTRGPINKDTTGYVQGFYPTSGFLKVPAKKRLTWNYSTNKRQMEYLGRLLTYLKYEGIAVVMTEHPMPAIYAPLDHELFVADIKKVADKYNVPFLDYMKAKDMTGIQYFSDETHLNIHGVAAYNRQLIADLQQKHLLPASGDSHAVSDNALKQIHE